MLLHSIQCPHCKSTLSSKAGIPAGQQLNCPKCKSRFVAGAPEEDFEVVDEADVVEDEPAPKKKPAAAARPAKRRPADDDDEDDDEEDRPRRKKGRKEKSGYQKLRENLWVRIATLVVLLAILGVLLYFYLEKRKKDREAEEHNQKQGDYSKPLDSVKEAENKSVAEAQRLQSRMLGQWKVVDGQRPAQGLFEEITLGMAPFQQREDLDGRKFRFQGVWNMIAESSVWNGTGGRGGQPWVAGCSML